jgi:hypothetical protein
VEKGSGQANVATVSSSTLNELMHMGDLGSQLHSAVKSIQGMVPPRREILFIRAHRFLSTFADISNTEANPDEPGQMVHFLARLQNNADKGRHACFLRVQKAFAKIAGVDLFVRQSSRWTVHIGDRETGDDRPLDECGDGLRDLLGLILRVEAHPEMEIMLDEPGVRLHPRAQRALLEYLCSQASSRPIWIATHDGVFIGSPDVRGRYAVSRANGISSAREVKDPHDVRAEFSLLGWSPRDAMMAEALMFCEGPSDRIAFDYILGAPNHPTFRGVDVVELGGERVWGADVQRLKTLIDAIQATAPHVRLCAVLDKGTRSSTEYDALRRRLEAYGVAVTWLTHGELENYWLLDPDLTLAILRGLCPSTVPFDEGGTRSEIMALTDKLGEKGSTRLDRVCAKLNLRFSKRDAAKIAVREMAAGKGGVARMALLDDLRGAVAQFGTH